MPNGWTQKIVNEAAATGAIAQVVESYYDSGGTVSHLDDDIMLRFRLWPYKVEVRSWHAGSRPIPVGRMIVMPGQVEAGAIALQKEMTSSLSLRISRDWLEAMTGSRGVWKVEDPASCIDFRDPDIEYAMRRIAGEVMKPGPCSRLILESCVSTIVADLVRRFETQPEMPSRRHMLSESRIRRVEEFVLNYPDGTPTLDEIAAEVNIDTSYLRQIFKKNTGKTLYKLVEEVRSAKAQKLLQETTKPLKVIAHELGFQSPSAFSNAFHKAVGMTPREFRVKFGQLLQ
jgi:AraC family transcriptional regulator